MPHMANVDGVYIRRFGTRTHDGSVRSTEQNSAHETTPSPVTSNAAKA